MKRLIKFLPFLLIPVTVFISGCESQPEKVVNNEPVTLSKNPEWAKDAVIYEVNTRQFTEEGTFAAFASHLPRLKELGVDILWFMPIHPIGEENRKGSLGSYYSIKDYTAVNPEFGSMADFKALVELAHEMGFKVILDWVANHTAFDHEWVTTHPQWYNRDENGEIVSPYDWTDVADLNYNDNPELWDAMIGEMKFWVSEANIDGFRCDVAGMVPVEFWDRARKELDEIKPVFMLAEDEGVPELTKYAFGANYGWEVHHIFNKMAKGENTIDDLWAYLKKNDSIFEPDVFRMTFTSNHDENSWNGTVFERLGDGAKAFAVLTYTIPGFPLIYNGQEAGLDKRLEFFEKDQIDWESPNAEEFSALYTKLNKAKSENPALWNAGHGGKIEKIDINVPDKVLAFSREKDDNKVSVYINMTAEPQNVIVTNKWDYGTFTDLISGSELLIRGTTAFEIPAWGYYVLKEKK
jgi:glycosidase